MPNFPKNKHFLPPGTYTHVCVSGGKKCLFFGNFGVLCFLETPVLRFALLPYCRRIADFEFDNSCNFTVEFQKNIIEQTKTYTTDVKKFKQRKNEIESKQNETRQILLKDIRKDVNKEKIRED